jgi:hypothetical protein
MVFTHDWRFGNIRAYPPGTHPEVIAFRLDDQSPERRYTEAG